MTQGISDGGVHHRKSKRSLVLLAAKIRAAGKTLEARLRNLSQKGALLEAESAPPVGTDVVFERGQTVVPARVAWVANGRFGIEFLEQIEESEVLIHVGRPKPSLETKAPVFRRSGFHGSSLNEDEHKLGAAWATPGGRALGD